MVGDDGRLSWIIDAYTSSDTLSLLRAQPALDDQPVNYMRNSVKAVVDAYDGTVTFYVFDNARSHPRRVARHLSGAVQGRVGHARRGCARTCAIPKLLLSLQAEVYGLYHMTDPEVFYNREDQWTVATENGSSQGGDQAAQPMQPELRAHDAARRIERTSSSSRFFPSRPSTATT